MYQVVFECCIDTFMEIANWLSSNKEIGMLRLRLFVGARLVYGVADNVWSWEHMLTFKDFLSRAGFPFPLLYAVVSVYAQLISGLMTITGYYIRLAAAIMIINFTVALLMVRLRDTIEGMTPALAMLLANVLFLFYGKDKYSLSH